MGHVIIPQQTYARADWAYVGWVRSRVWGCDLERPWQRCGVVRGAPPLKDEAEDEKGERRGSVSVEKIIVAEPLLWGGTGFAMFGPWHLLWLAICAAVIVLLVHGYRSLPANDSWRGGRRWLVLLAAVVPNALLLWGDVIKVQTGTFSPNWWPLHLCNVAEYVCLWHALAPSRVTRELLLCFGLTGGLCAMLFPGWTYCPPYTLPCISGFLEHAFIFSVSLMALDDPRKAPRWRDAWISLAAAVFYLVVFRWFNGVFDTNFGFVTSPAVGSPLAWWEDAFGNPGYLVPYMASFAVAVVLLHAWQERRRRREASSREGGAA